MSLRASRFAAERGLGSESQNPTQNAQTGLHGQKKGLYERVSLTTAQGLGNCRPRNEKRAGFAPRPFQSHERLNRL